MQQGNQRLSLLERADQITKEHPRTKIGAPYHDPSRKWTLTLPGHEPRPFKTGRELLDFVGSCTDSELDGEEEPCAVAVGGPQP
jgi:hypothetical protein